MLTGIRGLRLGRSATPAFVAAAGLAISLFVGTAGAQAKAKPVKPPKPVVSGLTASSSTVPSGGIVTISAEVSNAETCTLSANKALSGLPVTSPCAGGSFSREVTMPDERNSKKPVAFKLKLTAVGQSGKGNAKVEVVDSNHRYSDTATTVAGLSGVVQLGVGSRQACAVLSGGDVSCWGSDREGQLFNGLSTREYDHPIETLVTGAIQVSGGGGFSCATLSSGHVVCSGYDGVGDLGDGKTGVGTDEPVEVVGLTEAVQVAAGLNGACARLADGHVECWGVGTHGELGNGHQANSSTPVEVQGIADATEISQGASGDHTCALLASGHVECWGSNAYGDLGNGSTADSDVPVEVTGLSEVTSVSAGSTHTCALLSSGHVDCWGSNGSGELGVGSTGGESDVPVEVTGIAVATGVSVGSTHSCAALVTGRVECWGGNPYGQLGNGTTTDSDVPVEVLGVEGVASVSAGGGESCALLTSTGVECWGRNEEGQLGNGTFI